MYDFCVGEQKCKELFADDFKICGAVHFIPLKLKYLLIVYTKIFHEKVMKVETIALDQFCLKEKRKNYFRRNAKSKRDNEIDNISA